MEESHVKHDVCLVCGTPLEHGHGSFCDTSKAGAYAVIADPVGVVWC